MAACPSCNRPVAMARPSCLYCGSPLPAEAVEEAAKGAEALRAPAAVGEAFGRDEPATAAPETGPRDNRLLLILDLTAAPAVAAVAEALGLPAFEAHQRVRRGGYQLQRLDEADRVSAEAERLAALGLEVVVVPELETRAMPVAVLGGGRDDEGLRLRAETGPLLVRAHEVFLVVRGPIAREYQAAPHKRKQVSTASLEGG